MITFVNPLRVPSDRTEEFLRKWRVGADYVSSQPGFVASTLHRSLDSNGTHQFFTVAVWQTREDFDRAVATPWWKSYVGDFGFSDEPDGFAAWPALCTIEADIGGVFAHLHGEPA